MQMLFMFYKIEFIDANLPRTRRWRQSQADCWIEPSVNISVLSCNDTHENSFYLAWPMSRNSKRHFIHSNQIHGALIQVTSSFWMENWALKMFNPKLWAKSSNFGTTKASGEKIICCENESNSNWNILFWIGESSFNRCFVSCERIHEDTFWAKNEYICQTMRKNTYNRIHRFKTNSKPSRSLPPGT